MSLKEFIHIIIENIISSFKSERLKEANELLRIYNESMNKLNSQNRFIRKSTYNQISNRIISFEAKSFLNRNMVSEYESKLLHFKNQHNEIFRKQDLEFATSLFAGENGKSSLNEEQLAAVIADDDSNLIIAGAGSGKTTVIAHKVKYLVEKGIDPNDILLLSFTKASATSLKERIQNNMGISVEATTLHSFAYSTYKSEYEKPPQIADEKKLYGKVYEALLNTLSNTKYLRPFLEFYGKYFYDIKPLVYYKNIQELRTDLYKVGTQLEDRASSDEELELRKRLSTLKGELVRSVDERYIADFLYIHGIRYEYEKKYELASYDYYPDFYLTDYAIYLEHFAVDKNGNAPAVFDNPKKYVQNIQIKRDLHKKMGTKLVETTTWQLNSENSDEYLIKVLNGAGVETKNIDTSVVEHISRKFNQFINTFYTRLKLSGKTIEELKATFLELPYKVFFAFYEGFAAEFDKIRTDEGLTDFNDLLISATEVYRKGKGRTFKYIIVDEFQDTSWIAMKLLEAVYDSFPQASFFMVGDDWQSIYGFNGSDVNVLKQFKNKSGCEVKYLNKNYRSHQNIVELGKRFIECNDQQLKKDVLSANQTHKVSKIQFVYSQGLESEIRKIDKKESIFLLGRYNDDEPLTLINSLKAEGYLGVEFKTIHKSKGLEANNVFIIFPNEAKRDFPSLMQDHYIFNILKNTTETYPFAEERRLLYVAITRAERNVIFVSPSKDSNPDSVFWAELIKLTGVNNV